ncbi:MAG: thermonuclease family protein [Lachnospiraceae bacterium]|nr:thermonuclease family protein [Lachnospiraceae bacterium]
MKGSKFFTLLLALILLAGLTACQKDPAVPTGGQESTAPAVTETEAAQPSQTESAFVYTDYVGQLKLDERSSTLKQTVTVKTYVDGDTTHFFVPESVAENGVLKARYLAVNTPESTGKVEEWGKTASNFTRSKLSTAAAILVESDDGNWNVDSTGGRWLVWVWYKPTADADWRNLNVELLQNGLAIASSSANNRYGSICTAAIAQAKTMKLAIYSGEKDPDFYYGDAREITLKELRLKAADFNGDKVAFEGVVTRNYNNSIYVEDLDPETGLYFGMTVYLGYGLSGEGLEILNVGNRARIVGTVSYYEAGGTYQVSGLTYRAMKPNDPGNIQKISEGNAAAYVPTDPATFNGRFTIVDEDGTSQVYNYAELVMDTSISMQGLRVVSFETTTKEDSSSYGAMTLMCVGEDGTAVQLRTSPLRHEDGSLVTGSEYKGHTLDVQGIVGVFNGNYQIKLFTLNDITIVN